MDAWINGSIGAAKLGWPRSAAIEKSLNSDEEFELRYIELRV
jgi:hypothetical protein